MLQRNPGSPLCKSCSGAAPQRSPAPPPPSLVPPARWVAAKPCHPGGLFIFIPCQRMFEEHHYCVRLRAPPLSLFRPPLILPSRLPLLYLPPLHCCCCCCCGKHGDVLIPIMYVPDSSSSVPHCWQRPIIAPLPPAPNTQVPRTSPPAHPLPLRRALPACILSP